MFLRGDGYVRKDAVCERMRKDAVCERMRKDAVCGDARKWCERV